MSRKPQIKPYREPGGGWGATIATGKVLLEQKVLFKGALRPLSHEQARWLQVLQLRVA